jgi:group I intron endonuclease
MSKISGVYLIKCIANNKIYIGSTIDYKHRIENHIHFLSYNKHHNPLLQNDYNNYGSDCFMYLLLEVIDKELLIESEERWVDYFKSNILDFGYNIRKVVPCNYSTEVSQETRRKLAIASTGKKHTKESCKKISDSRQYIDKETYKKQAIKVTGVNNPNFGKRPNKKYVGVYRNYRSIKHPYYSSIRRCHIGCFRTEEEAAMAFNIKAKELYNIDYNVNIIST